MTLEERKGEGAYCMGGMGETKKVLGNKRIGTCPGY